MAETGGQTEATPLDHADVAGWGVLAQTAAEWPAPVESESEFSGSDRSLLAPADAPSPQQLTEAERRAREILVEVEGLTRAFITARDPGVSTPVAAGPEPRGTQPHMLRRVYEPKTWRRRSRTFNCLNVDLSYDIQCLTEAAGDASSDPSFCVIRVEQSTNAASERAVRVVITDVPEESPLHACLLGMYRGIVEHIRDIDREGVTVQKEVCWLLHQRKKVALTLTERMTLEILHMFFEDASP